MANHTDPNPCLRGPHVSIKIAPSIRVYWISENPPRQHSIAETLSYRDELLWKTTPWMYDLGPTWRVVDGDLIISNIPRDVTVVAEPIPAGLLEQVRQNQVD